MVRILTFKRQRFLNHLAIRFDIKPRLVYQDRLGTNILGRKEGVFLFSVSGRGHTGMFCSTDPSLFEWRVCVDMFYPDRDAGGAMFLALPPPLPPPSSSPSAQPPPSPEAAAATAAITAEQKKEEKKKEAEGLHVASEADSSSKKEKETETIPYTHLLFGVTPGLGKKETTVAFIHLFWCRNMTTLPRQARDQHNIWSG
jgi:hypothetical protein